MPLSEEWTKRAETIVRGLQDPSSGWYNSPDDLVRVISQVQELAYDIGVTSGGGSDAA